MNTGTYGKCLMAYHDQAVVEKLLIRTRPLRSSRKNKLRTRRRSSRSMKNQKDGFVTSIEDPSRSLFASDPLYGSPRCKNGSPIFFKGKLKEAEALKELLSG